MMPEMSRVARFMPVIATSGIDSVVQGKKQETNTGGKAKLPDHYRCTITCAFCGKRKHYEEECYHKQRLSVKLKIENGSGKGNPRNSNPKIFRNIPQILIFDTMILNWPTRREARHNTKRR